MAHIGEVPDPTLGESPEAKGKPVGFMAPKERSRTLELMKDFQDVRTDLTPTAFSTNQFGEK